MSELTKMGTSPSAFRLPGESMSTTQIVYDLGDMWNKAELLAHKKLDPLDDAFLDAFSGVEV